MTNQPPLDPKLAHAPEDMTPEDLEPQEGQEERPEAGLPKDKPKEPNPWLRDGADSADAADIEDPSTQL